MIKYIKGDIIQEIRKVTKPTLVPHITNDDNQLGSGIAKLFADTWPAVKTDYHSWFKLYPKRDFLGTTGKAKLGEVQFVNAEKNVVIANMVGQSDPGGHLFGNTYLPPIRYGAVDQCMFNVLEYAKRNKIQNILTVKFGSERAGGDWKEIEKSIQDIWINRGLNVTIVER